MELGGWAYFKRLRYLVSPLAVTSQSLDTDKEKGLGG